MQAQPVAPRSARQPNPRAANLVIVRANAPLFHSVAAASLLEAMSPVHARRLVYFFSHDAALCHWIEHEWCAGKSARAAELREYVELTWPELDWAAAYEQYRAGTQLDAGPAPKRPTAAHEALARCIAAAQSVVFYRSLARWADDLRLRDMARRMAQEEALSFARLRLAFERAAREQRFGWGASWRTLSDSVRAARDVHVQLAFTVLSGRCGPNVPFPVIDYVEFLGRMRAVIGYRGELGWGERLLFRAWLRNPRRKRTQDARTGMSRWFKPVLDTAA